MSLLVRQQVTTLLEGVRSGDKAARTQLFKVVYNELRGIAGGLMQRERADHTLQATALVNEAVMRLVGDLPDLVNRRHFFAAAVQAMRRVLVDYARQRGARKRGDGQARIELPIGDLGPSVADDPTFIVELDDALGRFEAVSPRQAEAFELWYFGGLTTEEIAEMLDVKPRTAQVDLKAAKTWIYAQFCA